MCEGIVFYLLSKFIIVTFLIYLIEIVLSYLSIFLPVEFRQYYFILTWIKSHLVRALLSHFPLDFKCL
jgi:hypothetical protein